MLTISEKIVIAVTGVGLLGYGVYRGIRHYGNTMSNKGAMDAANKAWTVIETMRNGIVERDEKLKEEP